MASSSAPILSREDIEVKAEEVIEYFDKNILKEPQFIPLIEYVQKLTNDYNVKFDFNLDLGETDSGKKILGKFVLKPRAILIDHSIADTSRFAFTLAHELGHLVLHRNVVMSKDEYNTIVDTEFDFVSGKKVLNSSRDWIEWQANQFASAILMPRKTFLRAIEKVQSEMGIRRNLGYIYLENIHYSKQDFGIVLNALAVTYRVNKTNLEYRMKDLGILIDNRLKNVLKNVRHISEMLKEEL